MVQFICRKELDQAHGKPWICECPLSLTFLRSGVTNITTKGRKQSQQFFNGLFAFLTESSELDSHCLRRQGKPNYFSGSVEPKVIFMRFKLNLFSFLRNVTNPRHWFRFHSNSSQRNVLDPYKKCGLILSGRSYGHRCFYVHSRILAFLDCLMRHSTPMKQPKIGSDEELDFILFQSIVNVKDFFK